VLVTRSVRVRFSLLRRRFRHPLDALTADEYWAVFETLKASGKVDAASRYAGVNLHEPPKAEVLRWKPGDPFGREALAIVKQERRTFEALVDVANRKLVSWKEIKGVEPVLIEDESEGVDDKVKADPRCSRPCGSAESRISKPWVATAVRRVTSPLPKSRAAGCNESSARSRVAPRTMAGIPSKVSWWCGIPRNRRLSGLSTPASCRCRPGNADYDSDTIPPREIPGRLPSNSRSAVSS
jgi:hypothetical protein